MTPSPKTGLRLPEKIRLTLVLAASLLACAALAAVASQAKPAPQIRLAYLQNDIHHLALWIALDKGYFKDEGAEVTVAGVFRAGAEIMSAFSAGELDMAYVGEAPATIAAARGTARIKAVAQVNTEGSALVVRPGSGVKTIADLRGKTVAVPGHSSVQDILLRRALSRASAPTTALNIIVVKPPEMIPALRGGEIDAFVAWEPYPSMAVSAGSGTVLAGSSDMWPHHPCCVLAADVKFLAANPDAAAAVARAHRRATKFIAESPDAAAAVAARYTGMTPDAARAAMGRVVYDSTLSVEGEREYVRFLTELRYIEIKDTQAFLDGFLAASPGEGQ
jgi:NitT/TauT family transport system substrate-binding protein